MAILNHTKNLLIYKIKDAYNNLQASLELIRYKKRQKKHTKRLKKILVLYYIPKDTFKSHNWKDGFVAALDLLNKEYNISRINIAEFKPSSDFLNEFDFIICKSNWNWHVDNYLRKEMKNISVPRGIMISGVGIPPSLKEMLFYDVLWFETYWYKKQIEKHPNCHHAFGIDASTMQADTQVKKEYDWISIGAFTSYKRYELFSKLNGKKIAIGEDSYNDSSQIIESLNKKGVETKPFLSHEKLCEYLNKSSKLYIPAELNGGGERAILEARSCGLKVLVEADNPKLKELTNSPIYDHHYYSNQLKNSMLKTLSLTLNYKHDS